MNAIEQTLPEIQSQPQTEAPVQPVAPAVDPFRQAEEVLKAIAVDCRVTPYPYLEQLRVPGGGE